MRKRGETTRVLKLSKKRYLHRTSRINIFSQYLTHANNIYLPFSIYCKRRDGADDEGMSSGDADESKINGHGCGRIVGNKYQSTQAVSIANNKNAKNSSIENCNSSSSSSHHNPSKEDNNNNKNNETSISPSSSSSDNYFSATTNDSQELQCHHFINNCNNQSSAIHSSSLSSINDNNSGLLQSIDDSLDSCDSSLSAVANKQKYNGQQSLQGKAATSLQNNNAPISSSSSNDNNHVPSSPSSSSPQPLPIGTRTRTRKRTFNLFVTAIRSVSDVITNVVGGAISLGREFLGGGKRRKIANTEGDSNAVGGSDVDDINSMEGDITQINDSIIDVGENSKSGSSMTSSASGGGSNMRRLVEGDYATSNITHGPSNNNEVHPLIQLSHDLRVVASEGTDISTLFCMTKNSMTYWCRRDEDGNLYNKEELFGMKLLEFWSSKQEVNETYLCCCLYTTHTHHFSFVYYSFSE